MFRKCWCAARQNGSWAMTLTVDIERTLGAFRLKTVFEAGEGVTALFGRSGGGKNSVVNAIAGILRPDRGRVVISGEAVLDSQRGIDGPAAPWAKRPGFQ